MKSFVFNVSFCKQAHDFDKLVAMYQTFIDNCHGEIIIGSARAKYNYKSYTTRPHMKSLCYGQYIEDKNGKVIRNEIITSAMTRFVSSILSNYDLYIVAHNGYYYQGSLLCKLLEEEEQSHQKQLASLKDVYIIYVVGDIRTNIFLKQFSITYNQSQNISIITSSKLDSSIILSYITRDSVVYSDQIDDLNLLNNAKTAFALGNDFDFQLINNNVSHIDKYYFVNKYVDLLTKGDLCI